MNTKKIATIVSFVILFIAGFVFNALCLNTVSVKLDETNDRVAALEQQNDELKDEINSMSDALVEYESENASLTDALVDMNDEMDKQKDIIEDLQKEDDEQETTTEETTTEETNKGSDGLSETVISSTVKAEADDSTMTFSAVKGEEDDNCVVKEDMTPWKVYEEAPKVNPPYEQHLTKQAGVFYGVSGKETYYNLDMSGVISIMRSMGYSEEEYPYWVRDDGAKMFGDYVMVAANLNIRPKGTIIECSLGTAMVVDTGGFAASNPTQLDIATAW